MNSLYIRTFNSCYPKGWTETERKQVDGAPPALMGCQAEQRWELIKFVFLPQHCRGNAEAASRHSWLISSMVNFFLDIITGKMNWKKNNTLIAIYI